MSLAFLKKGKVSVLLRPEKVSEQMWVAFINNHCSNCENPKNGCSQSLAAIHQAVDCFNKWLKEETT